MCIFDHNHNNNGKLSICQGVYVQGEQLREVTGFISYTSSLTALKKKITQKEWTPGMAENYFPSN